MRRRAYLALSAALLAGCGRSSPPADATTATDDTPVDVTETPSETTETTETTEPPETSEETETTETTSTPEPDPDAAAAIDEADAHIVDAVEKYASYEGEGASFLDVTAATGEFATGTISERVADARDALEAAAAAGTEAQKRTVGRLREAAKFVLNAAVTQDRLERSYRDYANGFELIYIDQYSKNVVEDVREAAAAVSQNASTIASGTSPACAEATTAFTADEYERKREQVLGEVRTYELAGTHFVPFDETRDALHAAANAYDEKKWDRAADRFESLASTYGKMLSDVGSHEAPKPLDEQFAPFSCDVIALAEGCGLLAESATLRSEGKTEEADATRRESRSLFEECGTFDRLRGLGKVY